MNKNKNNTTYLTLIDGKKPDIPEVVKTDTYQSDPLKTDLYSRLNAFRNSQKKFRIQDVIKNSLK